MIRLRAVLPVALAVLAAAPALAQAPAGWADKPVRLVVPYPPGGNVDTAARIVAEQLQVHLKQPLIVENKPGAGGMIAGESVAKAAPDGCTYSMGANGPILFSPMIFRRNAYDWKKDFVPVGSVSFTPLAPGAGPHPVSVKQPPDEGALMALLYRLSPDPANRQRVLVDNPARFFGFDS